MPRHVDWEILVHLADVPAKEVSGGAHKDDYFKAIEDRYCSKYCNQLGIEPLPHNKAIVAREAPIAECEMEAHWNEASSSAAAATLAISQPHISSVHEAARDDGRNLSLAQRTAMWSGGATFLDIAPPNPLGAVACHLDVAEQKKLQAKASKDAMSYKSLFSMKLHDDANDLLRFTRQDEVDDYDSLIRELERTRVRVREDLENEKGKADKFGSLLKNKGKREADEKELEELKSKFLLPFACERIGSSSLLPWQSPEIKNSVQIHVHEDFMADALKPICLTVTQMETECIEYATSRFPVELLTTRADGELFTAIREQLVTDEAIRLVGLLSHFLYWLVLAHIHPLDRRLKDQSKQSLVLTIQELWAVVQAPARQKLGRRGEVLTKDGPAGISFVLPAFMLALKRGVEWCFRESHPWMWADAAISTQLIDQLNLMFMRLFDPDCLLASFGALEASEKAIAVWHKLAVLQASFGMTSAKRMISQEFRVTPMMSLLMNTGVSPGDARTRILLAKTNTENMINPQGSCGEMTGKCRASLFRSATKRLNGMQRKDHETAEGKAEKAATRSVGFMKKSSSSPNLWATGGSTGGKSRSGTITRSSERVSTVGSDSIHTGLFLG